MIGSGLLTVSAVDGFTPNVSDTFLIITHPFQAAGGSFGTVNSVGLDVDESFVEAYNEADVSVTVTD